MENKSVIEVCASWRQIITSLTTEAKLKVNGDTSYICPLCGHGSHGDGLTSNPKGKVGSLKCFGCGFSGDIISLYQTMNKVDFKEALSDLSSLAGISSSLPVTKTTNTEDTEVADYSDYCKEASRRLECSDAAISYLQSRGISLSIAKRCDIGFDDNWISPTALKRYTSKGKDTSVLTSSPRLIIPTCKEHYVARDIRSGVSGRYQKMNEGKAHTFMLDQLLDAPDTSAVFIVEGVFDALSFMEAGFPAVALNSTSRAKAFLQEITKKNVKAVCIVCLDKDDAGKKASDVICNGLSHLGIRYIVPTLFSEYKDANEYLVADRSSFILAAKNTVDLATRQPQPDSDIDKFMAVVNSKRYEAVPTGIEPLDKYLDGGFVNEWLVILSAPPGAGKTALATQICESFARSGRKSLYFNFEMTKDQLIARSLARSCGKFKALNIMRFYSLSEADKKVVVKAAENFKKELSPYLIYNPSDTACDLDTIIEVMEAFAEKCESEGEKAPIVFIDYLQMIEGRPKEDVTATIKRTNKAFKKYAAEHHSIVFCISAQSRSANRDEEARLDAGRDTSNIEYSSDLQLQLISDRKNPSKKTLYITKSRFEEPSLTKGFELTFNGKLGLFTFNDTQKPDRKVIQK